MPIDIATGYVELARDDFVLPGRVPIKWTRLYRSSLLTDRSSPLGPGWTTSWFTTLKRVEQTWRFSHEGVTNSFPDPDGLLEKGQVIRLLGAFLELIRENDTYIITRWDVESGEIQRFVFDPRRATGEPALVAIENVSGDGVELAWDTDGHLSRLRQRTENRTVLLNYSPAGLVSSLDLVTTEGARTELVRYEYEAARLSAAIDRRDLANRYEYDAQSRLKREALKDGAVYSYRYENRGRCIHFTGLDHYNEKRLLFLESASRTMVTNSYGKTTVYEYLPSGQIASEIDPLGNQRRTEFDEWGRTVAKIDPLGGTTRYSYDENGNRDSVTDPLGNTYHFKFNAYHQVLSLTNPLGKTWDSEYDFKRRLVSTSNPLGARWQVDYDEANNPAVITDPLGARRRHRFSDGLLSEMTDWMEHPTRFQWDAFGRVLERVDPTGARTAFRYDPVGNPIEVEFPDGGRLQATYDSGDNLSSFTNATGRTSRFRYGPCHRLLERVDPIGRVVSFQWGTETERLNTVINEKGENFRYFHDEVGRIVCECSFDGREQRFHYDANGNRITTINGNGERVDIKRDVAGRPFEWILPDGAVTRYEYDLAGRIIVASNPDVLLSFEYDGAGQLVCEGQGDNWVRSQYNAAGQLIRIVTSLEHEVCYDFDPNGRVEKLLTANGQSIFFERDERGLEIARQMPAATRLEQRFDSMGRLLEQHVGRVIGSGGSVHEPRRIGAEISKRRYQYGKDGLLLSIADGPGEATKYTYDPAERLLSALVEHESNEIFEYDSTDNLTWTKQGAGEPADLTRTYGPGNRLLTRGSTRYEYDSDGRLTTKIEAATSLVPRVWRYFWDAQGQLRKVLRPDGEKWEYKYDAFGRRVAKAGPTGTRRFVWNGDAIIQELSDDGQTVAWILEFGSFSPLAKVQDGTFCPIITDHLGTPREMLDSSGKLIWAASFSAWGQIERKHSSRPEHDCPIRFQGQWFDEESGLHYNRFRFFDPDDARFISPDPIALAGGRNLYQYVPNPVTWIDPFGLSPGSCGDESDRDKRDSSEREALVAMAKGDKRTGITVADMEAYKGLNQQLPDPFPSNMVRGPESHPDAAASSSQAPHGHVGPVGHIPITDA